MECSFTETHYSEIIQAFLYAGYHFIGFDDLILGDLHQVILRHDVDLSLEDAARIARLEARLGITSVYNILLTGEVYNPASQRGQELIREIRQLGGRIGLHIDPVAMESWKGDIASLYSRLRKMVDMATFVLGPLDSYSIHRPATNGMMASLDFDNPPFSMPPYAYSKVYKEDIIYISDSRREWRSGCICSKVSDLKGRSLQLLLHPIWWTSKPLARESVLQDWLLRQRELAECYLENNLSFYNKR